MDRLRPILGLPWPGGTGETRREHQGRSEMRTALDDLQRSERRMVLTRWVAAPWVVAQVELYSTFPYPPAIERNALILAALLPAGNLVIWLVHRRVRTVRAARALAVAGLGFDIVVASGFVWLYAFDQVSALWAVLLIIPLEGAIRFGLAGALGSWAAVAALYTAREAWGSARYDYEFLIESISFRMGIGLMIALVAGLMAQDLMRQRARVAEALEELRRVDALRANLISTLAHDVRNPLTTIRAMLQTLIRRGSVVEEDQRAEMLVRADRQAERMQRLSKGLLDLARMERGTMELAIEDVPLEAALREALKYLGEKAPYEIRVPDGLCVRADPARLEQIVVNLAENAVAYAEPPFEVEARQSDGVVAIEFRDHGPGVPPERVPTLFEPFAAGGRKGSVGLGLAIVRALAEAQGGTVSYRTPGPRDSRFVVELPASDGA
jgi:signal transduction histidine kinase